MSSRSDKRLAPFGGRIRKGGGVVIPGGGIVDPPPVIPRVPILLADFDYRNTSLQSSWKSGFTGFVSSYATDDWDFQTQTVAGKFDNASGSETMDNSNGGYPDQTAESVHDGSSFGNRNAWESDATIANASYLYASGNTAGDAGDSDFGGRFVFSCGTPEKLSYLMSKWNGGTGWIMEMTSIHGPKIRVYNASATADTSHTASLFTGGPQYIAFWYDASAGKVHLKTSLSTETTDTVATGAVTTTDRMRINALNALATSGQSKMQVHYAGVCVGSNAQAMYDEDFFRHAEDPATVTALTATSRNSLISAPISASTMGHYSGGTTYGGVQIPMSYNAALTGGIGLLCNGPITNLVPYSDVDTGATNSNITSTNDAADAADGIKSAITMLASANNGYQARTCVTVASSPYTASVYITESTAGLTGRVIMYDESNSAELGSQVWTGTSSPQDISVSASTIAAGISTSVRVEVDTNTETAIAYMWQLELGTGTNAKVLTIGSAATLVQSDYRSAGDHVCIESGEALAVFAISKLPASGETHYVFDTVTAADRRALSIDSSGVVKMLVNDKTGSLVVNLTVGTAIIDTEYTVQAQWDTTAPFSGSSVWAQLNAVTAVTGGSAFAGSAGFTTDVCLGASAATANTALNGNIARIKFWDYPTTL